MSNNGPRYQASTKTEHSCCWDASVLDTTVPPRYADDIGAGMICECEDIETAIKIAHALNRDAMS